MKYTAVLWDMDGVLMDSEPQHWRAWERTFRELFRIPAIDWEVYKHTIGVRYEVVADLYEKQYGVEVRPEEVKKRYFFHKAEVEAEEGYLLMPGVREVLSDLRSRGYRMAVASSSSLSDIERFVNASGLSDCFDLLFSGEKAPNSKPAPDTFLLAAEELGAKPEECIVVEDSENGVRAAKAAEMACIGLQNPGSGDQDLSKADIIVQDLRRVSRLI